MAMHKSRLMKEVEARLGKPLEVLLVEGYNKHGLPGMAKEWGIAKATIWYWLLAAGIHVQRTALAPGQKIRIEKTS